MILIRGAMKSMHALLETVVDHIFGMVPIAYGAATDFANLDFDIVYCLMVMTFEKLVPLQHTTQQKH